MLYMKNLFQTELVTSSYQKREHLAYTSIQKIRFFIYDIYFFANRIERYVLKTTKQQY